MSYLFVGQNFQKILLILKYYFFLVLWEIHEYFCCFQVCHSFTPNSETDVFYHPRFGLIRCIATIDTIKAGQEILINYGWECWSLSLLSCPSPAGTTSPPPPPGTRWRGPNTRRLWEDCLTGRLLWQWTTFSWGAEDPHGCQIIMLENHWK